jgi:hypothetical protein
VKVAENRFREPDLARDAWFRFQCAMPRNMPAWLGGVHADLDRTERVVNGGGSAKIFSPVPPVVGLPDVPTWATLLP